MRFFRRAPGPRPRRPRLQTSEPDPWDPPQTEFPDIVPINTLLFDRSERAAIAITGMSAYSNGFEFSVTRLIQPGTLGWDEDPVPGARGEPFAAHRSFDISLQLSDGRTVVSGRPHGDSQPTQPFLQQRDGGGTSHYNHSRWWAWPLPPSGPLEFICQWPTLGITETRVSIDAQLILDAARRSVQLWPTGAH
jgi:hypothetical protein